VIPAPNITRAAQEADARVGRRLIAHTDKGFPVLSDYYDGAFKRYKQRGQAQGQ
jgi:hypothetical protein